MGEIADMMLDGTMCQYCGVWLNEGEDGDGYPMSCSSCGDDDTPNRFPKSTKTIRKAIKALKQVPKVYNDGMNRKERRAAQRKANADTN